MERGLPLIIKIRELPFVVIVIFLRNLVFVLSLGLDRIYLDFCIYVIELAAQAIGDVGNRDTVSHYGVLVLFKDSGVRE